ncbi:MAG: hypothetical protein RIR04_2221 [Pseudomonadota bacterium]|jgi:hypothetical protein
MPINRRTLWGLTAALWGACSTLAWAEQPLSAIDWLSQSLVNNDTVIAPAEPPVTSIGLHTDTVTVQPLLADSADGLGILPPAVTGLPRNVWGSDDVASIVGLLSQENGQDLPALQTQLLTLLLAISDPPQGAPAGEVLFLARVDKLLAIGALDQARALLDTAGAARSPEIFRRYFDVALLIGDEDRACEALKTAPGLAPALPTRIFCLSRAGDFDTAKLTLDTARALGTVSPEEVALLTRFMEPELDDTGITPIMPNPVTPLIFRIYEAIGEPLPDTALPVAFTYADLSENAGWKAQLEAVERLSRMGSVAPNMLLGLYTQQEPAASGGVWDRVAAFQAFDAAISAKDQAAIEATLPQAWAKMRDAGLEVPFASLFGQDLADFALSEDAGAIALQVMLLSPDYENLTQIQEPQNPQQVFLLALARGSLQGVATPDALDAAIAQAFVAPTLPATLQAQLDQGRIGQAILAAMTQMRQGEAGDLRAVTEGLSTLRHLGLEDVARRSALQLVLLKRQM